MITPTMTLTGVVTDKRAALNSKSERLAFCLKTDDSEPTLRRIGGHPFVDAVLQGLLGKTITADGRIDTNMNTFFMASWVEH